ncbi:DNA/RNA non-specific endonuclease [Arcticibacterium luteifluviistationis]|uniref:Endonuclease n=1 Tax=Arcticibacterium luteifluviistationis TaxID=1784714 RepID=A0A2Z4G859_9BACT|nr:DNA/RNA non-specific endonuclease [Arcticibacterium luteifluviistationis]AWV97362.1 endonuclease [Arcticibacterium luteifluviistationis]
MAYSKPFWQKYIGSFWAFVLMLLAIYLLNHPDLLHKALSKFGLEKERTVVQSEPVNALYSDFMLPEPSTYGEWIEKPNFLVYYDEDIMQARFTLHKLEGGFTRGEASRYGIRFDDQEVLASQTAAYYDYSGSGYDRGHLVPAGDFKCCQANMEETFSMSNIAPFDSVLNRYAWNELEIKTRSWARKYGTIYVITGPVFEHRFLYIGKQNDVSVPTHFFKVLFTLSKDGSKPQNIVAYLMPNEALYHFEEKSMKVSIDKLEELTKLDFFVKLPDDLENKLEAATQIGNW